MKKSRWMFGAALIAVPLLLAGCVASVENFRGEPEEFAGEAGGDAESGVQAFWLHEGAQLAVTISGSSTCPYIASGITVLETADEGNRISVDVPPMTDEPCTMDFVPHTTVFSTPGTITTTKPLTIEVMDTEIELPIK